MNTMEGERVESIEACRTCGIFYMTSSNYLKHLFQSPVEQPEMMLIRLELTQWKVEVAENDGLPQYVCSTCIHEFQKVFKFRAACIETQEQFKYFCNLREENRANIKIKTERVDPSEEKPVCDFIYVDELSESEYDGATPFNVPHIPIKEELIEAATIPMEVSIQAVNTVESASKVIVQPEHSVLNIPLMRTSQDESVEANTVAVTERPLVEHIDCKLCQHVSYSNEEHKLHLQREHEIRDMECHICGKEFRNSTAARLKFHMKWHTLNKHVKCTLCGFVCSSKEALKEHKRANHIRVKCKICDKGILAKKMKSHLRNHELLTKYPCEYCTETFSTEDQRENHIWQLHANDCNNPHTDVAQAVKNEQQDILCQESEVDLIHYKFLCAHCEERFMKQVDLETHVREVHRPKTHLLHTELPGKPPFIQNLSPNRKSEEMSDTAKQIAVFEDYDNDDGEVLPEHEHYAKESDLLKESFQERQAENQFVETPHIMQTTFNSEHEDITERFDEPTQFHNEPESSSVESGDSSCETESEYKMPCLEENDSGDLKSFACAKCVETFSCIEELRQHHEQHLNASHKQQLETPNKLKFKCNLCEKFFDLKFSLNRHVKKHKHAPL